MSGGNLCRMKEIGCDIHFIHVRSKHENALPIIVTHGWPGSILHQLKIIDPLTNPTAHGGRAEDAFHVVIPSIPGYGYSGKLYCEHEQPRWIKSAGRPANGARESEDTRGRGSCSG
jgi:pimeloyl-ACP methyl ester carboxylesterase